MLIGRIHSNEVRTLPDGERMPEGWDFSNEIKRVISPIGPVEEIEAEDMDALLSNVPEGRVLLSVRSGK